MYMTELIQKVLSKYYTLSEDKRGYFMNILKQFILKSNFKTFEEYKSIDRDKLIQYRINNDIEIENTQLRDLVTVLNNINNNLQKNGLIEFYYKIGGVTKPKTYHNKSLLVESAKYNLNEKIQSKRILEIIQNVSKIDYDNRLKVQMIARNILIIKFIYLFALQSRELVKLKWSSIYSKKNKYYINIETGRGDSEIDICEINNESLIKLIYNYRALLVKNDIKSDIIFCSLGFRTLGKSMSTKGVNDIIVRLSKLNGESFSAINIRNLSNGHLFTHEYINSELKPSLRDKYFKCRSCAKLIKWSQDSLCEDCSKLDKIKISSSGYVYFIKTIGHNCTKIGISQKNVDRRLVTNQVGNMYELYLMGYLQSPDYKNIEHEIQSKLGSKNMRGEWFNVGEKEVIEVLKELGYMNIFTEVNKKNEVLIIEE